MYRLLITTVYLYTQTLDLLVVVLQQSKKESEDRWKRLSRQITDTLLPALTANQVRLQIPSYQR
jgi:hypothetical protein